MSKRRCVIYSIALVCVAGVWLAAVPLSSLVLQIVDATFPNKDQVTADRALLASKPIDWADQCMDAGAVRDGDVAVILRIAAMAEYIYPHCSPETQNRIIDILVQVATGQRTDHVATEKAVQSLKKSLANSPDKYYQALTRIVLVPHVTSGAIQAARDLAGHADLGDLPAMRAIFTEVADNQNRMHPSVIILADLGDEQALPAIDRLLAAGLPDEAHSWQLTTHRNMILLQHPPESLIREIAEGEILGPAYYDWAVRRACELGLDKSAIRDAVLARLERLDTRDRLPWRIVKPKLVAVARVSELLSEQEIADLPFASEEMDIPIHE